MEYNRRRVILELPEQTVVLDVSALPPYKLMKPFDIEDRPTNMTYDPQGLGFHTDPSRREP